MLLGVNLCSFWNYSFGKAIQAADQFGFEGIEFLACEGEPCAQFEGDPPVRGILPGLWPHKLTAKQKTALRNRLSKFDGIACHAPFVDCPLITCNERIRSEVVEQIKQTIDLVTFLGGTVTVVHPNRRKELALEEYWDDLIKQSRRLGDYAAKKKGTIALESGFVGDEKTFPELIHAIDHPAVGAAFDVGHAKRYLDSRKTPVAKMPAKANNLIDTFVKNLGEKIFHVHLHDLRAKDLKDHIACGTGMVDFDRLIRRLRKLDYQGLMTFEVVEADREKAIARSKRHMQQCLTSGSA